MSAFRLLAMTVTVVGTLSILLIASPVQFFYPLLRTAGVPEHRLPGNLLLILVAKIWLAVAGVNLVVVDKRSKKDQQDHGAKVFFYNHTSNFDPMIVAATCGHMPKFVYKKQLSYVPLLGWALFLYRHIAIDRNNRESAIASITKAAQKVVSKGQSIAIAPEGTRSRTSELLPFKKGPFHLWAQTGATVIPLIIQGAFEVLPPKSIASRCCTVQVTILDPVPHDPASSVDEALDKMHRLYETALKDHPSRPHPSLLMRLLPPLAVWVLSIATYMFVFA